MNLEREELAAWLLLLELPGLGRAGARRLMTALGPPVIALDRPIAELREFIGPAAQKYLLDQASAALNLADPTWQWLQADPDHREVVPLGHTRYPQALLEIEDPPLLLYMTGRLDLPLAPARALAVVGSRNPTPQGELNARQFSFALARQGLTIVSGLARGVDGAAHQAALEAAAESPQPSSLSTIAVVGTGLDRVYPRAHLQLAHAIARTGLLVSEFPLGTPPLAHHFPQRNRLIAGLSCATLVVEAALESGSLITAREAALQGKPVFAIPGSIHAPQARGCHALLREGAALVETADDVLNELPAASRPSAPQTQGAVTTAPPQTQDPILQALGWEPMSLDEAQARSGWPFPALQARLMQLELQGCVVRLPGGRVQRIAQT